MIRLAVDQNFNGHIVDGLTRRETSLDLVHVRDVGLECTLDPVVLEWAAAQDRVLLTHDRRTVPGFAYARVAAGQSMPGVFLVRDDLPVGQAVAEIVIAIHCLSPAECKNTVITYFPL